MFFFKDKFPCHINMSQIMEKGLNAKTKIQQVFKADASY